MSFPVLQTKLHIPSLREGIIERQMLLARLNSNADRKLTLVSAQAGFGKTTLVVEWLHGNETAAAWYSLDPADNDPVQFITYLIHALQRIYPQVGAKTLQALQSPQTPKITDLIPPFINEILTANADGILVLDDFHVIDTAEVWETLQLLVKHQPENLHIVLATREDPPLPLARLRALNQMLEIRAQDLQFTQEEVAQYLTEVMGFHLTPDQIAVLAARTEGWIAGLQLAAISMRGEQDRTAFIEAFSGSHRFVLDYLTEEILRNLPEDVRLFVLQTAVLDRLSAPLCDAVTRRQDSEQMLRQIEEMNLFIVQLDHERRWYRYHHLFAEILGKQLHHSHPQSVPILHARASAWYEAQGSIAEAVRHARSAEDLERVADLVEEHSIDVVKRGQIHLALRWIEALPAGIRESRPRLNMSYAWALFLSARTELLPAILDQIEGATDSPDILGEASAMRAFLCFDNPGKMQEYALHALDIIPEENVMVRGLAHMGLGNVHQMLGENYKAFEQFTNAIRYHWAADNRVAATNAILDLVVVNQALGYWKQIHQVIEDVLALARKDGASDDLAMGMAYIGLGWVLLHWNQPEQAVTTLRRGLEMADAGGYRAADVGLFPLTLTQIALGNTAEARALLQQIIEMLPEIPGDATTNTSAWIAHMLLLLGDLPLAIEWLRKPETQIHDSYPVTLTRSIYLQAMHDGDDAVYREAETRLDDAIRVCEERGWNGYRIEALNLRAMTRDALGDRMSALDDLRQALALAEPEGDRYAFVREGPALRSLLTELPENVFALTLLEAFPEDDPARLAEETRPGLIEPLSEREAEVLQLMTRGLTYNDIAGRLVVSVNTVRYHVKGLYRKLGASSRAEAIEKARALGLITPSH